MTGQRFQLLIPGTICLITSPQHLLYHGWRPVFSYCSSRECKVSTQRLSSYWYRSAYACSCIILSLTKDILALRAVCFVSDDTTYECCLQPEAAWKFVLLWCWDIAWLNSNHNRLTVSYVRCDLCSFYLLIFCWYFCRSLVYSKNLLVYIS